ncbi:MAG TPA: hypothetical protein VHX68_03390 [Planctomycetaceae bacterium]|jgi:hypothetical protein|nr:hypothetical protein [Planctomycetaceae bacterium]
MRKRLVILVLVGAATLFSASADAKSKSSGSGGSVHVRGYVTKKGTYVAPHTRHAPGTGSQSSSSGRSGTVPYTRGTPAPPSKPGARPSRGAMDAPAVDVAPVAPAQSAEKRYRGLLSNARALSRAGLHENAAAMLKRIIAGAPGTRVASDAKEELANLPRH